jgi:hypothetical protein
MSDPTLLQFLNSIRVRQDDIESVVGAVDRFARQLWKYFEDARPTLVAFCEGVQRLEQSPPVAGYEDSLIGEGHHALAARFLAWNIRRLGKQLLEERRAERKLSSAIYAVARVEHATPLVISRRARSIMAALGDGMAMSALCAACTEAGIPETDYSFRDLAECAKGRDATACARLFKVCKALKPHIVDPRGLVPSDASATHELYLYVVKRGYTYDAYGSVFKDAATRATRIAMNVEKFDPRPARRRLRRTGKGRG